MIGVVGVAVVAVVMFIVHGKEKMMILFVLFQFFLVVLEQDVFFGVDCTSHFPDGSPDCVWVAGSLYSFRQIVM